MQSKIYHGLVEHQRFAPTPHRLSYGHHVYALDLKELDHLDDRLLLFGYNRPRPVSLHDADHLEANRNKIREKVLAHLPPQLATDKVARIIMVTSPRLLGYVFNPVSFYYCFAADDRLLATLAEVNNTFGEKHIYPLVLPIAGNGEFPARYQARKAFHVSPFNPMGGTYTFSFGDIRRELDIQIDLHRDGDHILRARLTGRGERLTALSLLKTLLRHPIRPHLTMARIHREALKLFARRKLDVFTKPVPHSAMTIRRPAPTMFQRYSTRLVLRHMRKAHKGRLRLSLPDGTLHDFGQPDGNRIAHLKVNDHAFFSRVVTGSDIGLGEGFMEDLWDTDHIPDVLGFLIRNRQTLQDGDFKAGVLSKMGEQLRRVSRANTLLGSRRNIRAHYDLSNAFFQTFLDDSMAYSCAVFDHPDEPLETAQHRKSRMIMDKARLTASDHLLEIGCGWGGFAIEAVRQTGCRVTGITISKAQHALATERVRRTGMQDHIDIRLCDYRHVRGRFDKIVSIEMLEAVGHRYFKTYFKKIDELLAPRGIAVIQTITIPDQRYDQYRKTHDWIQKHIFPGGLLPSLSIMARTTTRHTRLMIDDAENIGNHYATTLALWQKNFQTNLEQVARMGFDRSFRRKWAYYLGCCEAGFRERALGNLQLVLTREGNDALKTKSSGGE